MSFASALHFPLTEMFQTFSNCLRNAALKLRITQRVLLLGDHHKGTLGED